MRTYIYRSLSELSFAGDRRDRGVFEDGVFEGFECSIFVLMLFWFGVKSCRFVTPRKDSCYPRVLCRLGGTALKWSEIVRAVYICTVSGKRHAVCRCVFPSTKVVVAVMFVGCECMCQG